MGKGTYPNGGLIAANVGDPAIIYVTITAAADVQASGYAVTKGGDYVSAVTRPAEGDMKIALRQGFPQFLGFSFLGSTRAGSFPYLDTAASIGDGTDPHIDLTWQEGDPLADKDPDSAVIQLALHVKRTKTGFSA